jgi:amidase
MIERVGREPREEELEPLTWAGIRVGRKLKGDHVLTASRTLRQLCVEILAFFEDFDVFVNPVMGTPPPPIGHIDPVRLDTKEIGRRQSQAFPFTPPFNFTGQPAMSVPLCMSSEGLPLGLQFAGRYGDETTLFRLAGQLEQASPWAGRKPQVWS